MRIVAGELGGRRLAAPGRSADVRPTSDKVREALFSMLGPVEDARVLDLFCGTGALGIEALSRGAAHATLVDTDTSLARSNVKELGIEDRCTVVRTDARRFLRTTRDRFDLAFCDPPYRLADRLEADLDQLIQACLSPGARVVLESDRRRPMTLSLPVALERRYGGTLVRIYAAEESR